MLKMKNIMLSLIASLIIIGFGATQVMAAELGANNTEVNVGDTVEVTVKLDEATRAVDLVLNYDSDNFTYVSVDSGISADSTAVNAKEAGVVRISAASVNTTTNEVKYTFTAKAVTDENTEPFTASGIVTESSEALTVDTVSVKVVEPAEEPEQPVEPEQPTEPEQPDLNEPADDNNQEEPTNNDNNNEKVDEDGNKITKLPQTGVSILNVLAIVAVAGVAVFGIRKFIKK